MKQVTPQRFCLNIGWLLAVAGLIFMLWLPRPAQAYGPPGSGHPLAICRTFQQTQLDFEAMTRLRAEQPAVFANEVYTAAAYNYINQA
ncbi:MAG: hypothetical protein KDI79_26735, partial [Anaerolineae bacterium]|nr:hypothetical protein [Anaerolineae bacterium]